MGSTDNYRLRRWQPPPRPDWVRRVNEEGSFLDLKSVVPLNEDSLISVARSNTGLSDFGDDDWYEPFKMFIRSLEEEAELNLIGRLLTRSDLLMYLEARLRIEDTYRRHPEIDAQELAPPMLIVGSGRSGTSAIQNLLSLDPDNGTPRHWEALFPCPPPEAATYRTDARIAIADRRMTQWNRVTPEMAAMHEFGGDMPTELIQLEALSFQSIGWLIFCGFTPTFDAYMATRSGVPGLNYAKRILKLLQWKNPRPRWLLKSPDAMRYLPDVFKEFPDMQLIWMHRDPLKTVSSVISLIGTILWMRSDRKMDERATAQQVNPAAMAGLFNLVMDQMEQGRVPARQMRHVQYVDFISDPLGSVETLYREMGIALTDRARQAMTVYLREHPRESRPAHKYSDGDAERRAEERKLYERYQTHFGVKNET
jgi:Sulfotransferase family